MRQIFDTEAVDCRKVIDFATYSMLHNWLKKLAPLFHPIDQE